MSTGTHALRDAATCIFRVRHATSPKAQCYYSSLSITRVTCCINSSTPRSSSQNSHMTDKNANGIAAIHHNRKNSLQRGTSTHTGVGSFILLVPRNMSPGSRCGNNTVPGFATSPCQSTPLRYDLGYNDAVRIAQGCNSTCCKADCTPVCSHRCGSTSFSLCSPADSTSVVIGMGSNCNRRGGKKRQTQPLPRSSCLLVASQGHFHVCKLCFSHPSRSCPSS